MTNGKKNEKKIEDEEEEEEERKKNVEAKTIYTKKIKIPGGNKFSLPNENLFTFWYRFVWVCVHVSTNIIYILIDNTI